MRISVTFSHQGQLVEKAKIEANLDEKTWRDNLTTSTPTTATFTSCKYLSGTIHANSVQEVIKDCLCGIIGANIRGFVNVMLVYKDMFYEFRFDVSSASDIELNPPDAPHWLTPPNASTTLEIRIGDDIEIIAGFKKPIPPVENNDHWTGILNNTTLLDGVPMALFEVIRSYACIIAQRLFAVNASLQQVEIPVELTHPPTKGTYRTDVVVPRDYDKAKLH